MAYMQNRERVNQPRSLLYNRLPDCPLAKYRCAKRYSAFTGAFGAANWLYFAWSVSALDALYR
jgi:hypothetical protein